MEKLKLILIFVDKSANGYLSFKAKMKEIGRIERHDRLTLVYSKDMPVRNIQKEIAFEYRKRKPRVMEITILDNKSVDKYLLFKIKMKEIGRIVWSGRLTSVFVESFNI